MTVCIMMGRVLVEAVHTRLRCAANV